MADIKPLARDRRSLVDRATESIQRLIDEAELGPGDKLPGELQLAEQLEVSRSTVREALNVLAARQRVERRQGVGTIVRATPVVVGSLNENLGVTELIRSAGYEPSGATAEVSRRPATDEERDALQLGEDAAVVAVERIYAADGQPVAHSIDVVPATSFDGASASYQPDESLYAFLQQHCDIAVTHGIARVRAGTLDPSLAEAMERSVASPTIVIRQLDFNEAGQPVLFGFDTYSGEAFELSVVRRGPFDAQ
jgi:GntR family transcriptional regulator